MRYVSVKSKLSKCLVPLVLFTFFSFFKTSVIYMYTTYGKITVIVATSIYAMRILILESCLVIKLEYLLSQLCILHSYIVYALYNHDCI